MNVLIIEDDEALAEMAQMIAALDQHTVTVFTDPALVTDEHLTECEVALVDYNMPRIDGCQVLTRLAAVNPHALRALWSAVEAPPAGNRLECPAAQIVIRKSALVVDNLRRLFRGGG